jgi:hypothetical protein
MKTRIKTRQMPGDVSKQEKQAMLEGRHKDKTRAKSFKKEILSRERAVEKERQMKEKY